MQPRSEPRPPTGDHICPDAAVEIGVEWLRNNPRSVRKRPTIPCLVEQGLTVSQAVTVIRIVASEGGDVSSQ